MTCELVSAIAGAVTLAVTPNADLAQSDALVIAPHDTHAAQVCYFNHPLEVSPRGSFEIALPGGLAVVVAVRQEPRATPSAIADRPARRATGREIVTVTPPPGILVSVEGSADYGATASALIPDGAAAVFLVTHALF